MIVPEDLGDKIRSLASLNPESPEIQIIVNGSDAVESRVTDDRIRKRCSARRTLLLAKRPPKARRSIST